MFKGSDHEKLNIIDKYRSIHDSVIFICQNKRDCVHDIKDDPPFFPINLSNNENNIVVRLNLTFIFIVCACRVNQILACHFNRNPRVESYKKNRNISFILYQT